MSKKNKDDVKLFMYLVNTFQSSAQIAMGEMKNPVTDKIETNIDKKKNRNRHIPVYKGLSIYLSLSIYIYIYIYIYIHITPAYD